LTHVDYSPGEQPVNLVEVEETVSSPTRKPKRRWWIWLLLLLLIVFSAAGYYLWTNPVFGEKLPEFTGEMIQTFTPLPAVQIALSGTLVSPTQQTPISGHSEESGNVTVKKSDAVCGQTEPMVVLALGIDEVEQADVIRLVRVDFVARKALVLSIPRDFWVPIRGWKNIIFLNSGSTRLMVMENTSMARVRVWSSFQKPFTTITGSFLIIMEQCTSMCLKS